VLVDWCHPCGLDDEQCYQPTLHCTALHCLLMYRPCTAGTMEEMVYSRQIYKQQHSEMVLEGKTQPRVFEGGASAAKAGPCAAHCIWLLPPAAAATSGGCMGCLSCPALRCCGTNAQHWWCRHLPPHHLPARSP
jgi:hypothetical protein